jgi:hypothetical protein
MVLLHEQLPLAVVPTVRIYLLARCIWHAHHLTAAVKVECYQEHLRFQSFQAVVRIQWWPGPALFSFVQILDVWRAGVYYPRQLASI